MRNIILIGMPGVGKSTVGVVLAKKLGYNFLDSDLLIQEKYKKLLHEIIEERGIEGFWQVENEVNASIKTDNTVIATGGSVIYGKDAMVHLSQLGTIVYLKLSCEELAVRLGDLNDRGVTLKEGQDLKGLYAERIPYYERYAELTIDCEDKMIRDIVEEIKKQTYSNTVIRQ